MTRMILLTPMKNFTTATRSLTLGMLSIFLAFFDSNFFVLNSYNTNGRSDQYCPDDNNTNSETFNDESLYVSSNH